MQVNPIPYGKQSITDEDIAAVVSTLRSELITQGPRNVEFEQAFAAYIGSKYAIALANGTAALHLAAMALNIKPGQKVITTPITFAASANCVRYCGGEVVFADIDPETYLLDIEAVKAMLKASPADTYAGIIPVDFAGAAVDMEAFRQLADEYGLWLIEDACHAPGGFFVDSSGGKQFCGNAVHADMAIFSFHPVKHITCGEGGIITTNNEVLFQKLMDLRTHGIIRNSDRFLNDNGWASGNSMPDNGTYPPWYMEMQELGYNYRLTDFQAALGLSQLKRADEGLTRRRQIAAKYASSFEGEGFLYGQSGFRDGHAYHLYILEVENRLELFNYLRRKNVFPQVHYIPVHLMPYYRQQGFNENDYPFAEQYYSRCLSLPMYPTLTAQEQQHVIDTVKEFYQ